MITRYTISVVCSSRAKFARQCQVTTTEIFSWGKYICSKQGLETSLVLDHVESTSSGFDAELHDPGQLSTIVINVDIVNNQIFLRV